jgi:hypothetical protein
MRGASDEIKSDYLPTFLKNKIGRIEKTRQPNGFDNLEL